MKRFMVCAAVVLAAGCGEKIKRPSTSDLVVSGRVFRASSGSSEPFGGAEVRASVDRNQNGAVDADEAVTATADDQGNYRLQMKVSAGERVVLRFSGSDAAPVFRSVDAGPWAELSMNANLRELESMSCDDTGTRCAVEDNKLSLTGLAEGVSGAARVFNPEKETNAFPGGFDDSSGNLLVSGVFGSVQLQDAEGNPVENLEQPAELRMRVPQETWKMIVDLHPGDDRIQIPMYAFNETSGEWEREGEGFLETATGAVIPEAKLAEIRAGSFPDGVVACASVNHFSFWNVDWPIDTKQCVTAVVLDDDGKPAEGATVYVSGITYTGSSKAQTVGADGRFCTEVMRSDKSGEDVDQDNRPDETQRIRVRILYGGKVYDGGDHDVPSDAATCAGGGCLDLGDLQLSVDKEIVPRVCEVKGKVLDERGQGAVEGVPVIVTDPSVPQEVKEELCGFASLNCSLIPPLSGADGTWSTSVPVLDGVDLFAFKLSQDDSPEIFSQVRLGYGKSDGCPAEPIDLWMNEGYDKLDVKVAVAGQQLSWTPADRKATSIEVLTTAGDVKWHLRSTEGLTSPVTYGTVPANAEQLFPEDPASAPAALASGDRVVVRIEGQQNALYFFGTGEATAP